MNNSRRFGLWAATLMGILAALPFPISAAPGRPESQLIQMLSSSNSQTVIEALDRLPRWYPHSTNAVPLIRGLLKDNAVRRRAARALGEYQAELTLDEVKAILALLRSPDANEAVDGLKALRGLREPEAIRDRMAAEIIPLLKDQNIHVVRDACRTLGVVGGKEAVASLQPLLVHSRQDVRQDARQAIDQLAGKSGPR